MRLSTSTAAPTYGKGEVTVDRRVRNVGHVSPSPEIVLEVTRRLEAQQEILEQHFAVELGGCEPPQFLRYRVGDFFVAHQDGNTGLINLDSDRTRRLSVTLFLNQQSVEDNREGYNGGSLVFSDWRSGMRHEVVGEAGMLVAFRSETTHEVTPVTRGERYVIVSWYRQRPVARNQGCD